MKKEASLPVRLDTEMSRRLDLAAERLGLTKSALIRILVKSFVEQLEVNGGKITFPLRWQGFKKGISAPSLQYVAAPRAKYGGKKARH